MNELYDYVQGKVVAENPAQQPTEHLKDRRGVNFQIAKSGKNLETERLIKIKFYFNELLKADSIETDIFNDVSSLVEKPQQQLSSIEKQQYSLVLDTFGKKIKPVEFVRKWDNLKFGFIQKEKTKSLADSVVSLVSNDPKNRAFGSAFIIAHHNNFTYLLTAAHVIEQINSGKEEVGSNLKILGIEANVEVVALGSTDSVDIALIKVLGILDKPACENFVLGEEINDVQITGFSSFGNKSYVIRTVNGKLCNKFTVFSSFSGEISYWDLIINDENRVGLEQGYSGSPVYNNIGAIMAIVTHRRNEKLGHAICISNLKKICPEITSLIPDFKQL